VLKVGHLCVQQDLAGSSLSRHNNLCLEVGIWSGAAACVDMGYVWFIEVGIWSGAAVCVCRNKLNQDYCLIPFIVEYRGRVEIMSLITIVWGRVEMDFPVCSNEKASLVTFV
jgi:hypothetical protein